MNVAIYTRVSSDRQREEGTIQSQIAALETKASESGWSIIRRYSDEGFSGSLLERPGLDQLRDDAGKGFFNAVVIHSPDRLARKFLYQQIVLEELKNKGIEVIFLNQKIAQTPEDQLLLSMQGVIAEFERAKITERTRRGRLHKAREGYIAGGGISYGYNRISKDKSETDKAYYVINEKEAKNVRLIFSLVGEQHMSTNGIVRELHKRGILPKGGKELWGRSTIAQILRNEIYIGKMYYNKRQTIEPTHLNSLHNQPKYRRRKKTSRKFRPKEEWITVTNGIPPLIPKELFERTQEQLNANYHYSRRNTKLQYLLGMGLLRCELDGCNFVSNPARGIPFYRCSLKNRLKTLTPCKSRYIAASIIEPLVWNTIVEALRNPKQILTALQKRQQNLLLNSNVSESGLKEIENSLAQLKITESRLLEAYGNGIITMEQLRNQNITLLTKKKTLEKEKAVMIQKTTANLQYNKEKVMNYVKKFQQTLLNVNFDKKLKIVRELLKEALINTNERTLYAKIAVPLPDQWQHEQSSQSILGNCPLQYPATDNNQQQFIELEVTKKIPKKAEDITYPLNFTVKEAYKLR